MTSDILTNLLEENRSIKYASFPLAKNKIIFRLENIGDHLDSKETALTVDIYQIA